MMDGADARGEGGPVFAIGIGRGFLLGLGDSALDFIGKLPVP